MLSGHSKRQSGTPKGAYQVVREIPNSCVKRKRGAPKDASQVAGLGFACPACTAGNLGPPGYEPDELPLLSS